MTKTITSRFAAVAILGTATFVGCGPWPVRYNPPPAIEQHRDLVPDSHLELLLAQSARDVHFGAGESVLRADQRAILVPAVPGLKALLRDYKDLVIVIEGHGDGAGSNSSNLELGRRRAEAVREILIGEGIPAPRLRTASLRKRYRHCVMPDEDCRQTYRIVSLRAALLAVHRS